MTTIAKRIGIFKKRKLSPMGMVLLMDMGMVMGMDTMERNSMDTDTVTLMGMVMKENMSTIMAATAEKKKGAVITHMKISSTHFLMFIKEAALVRTFSKIQRMVKIKRHYAKQPVLKKAIS